MLWMSRGQYLFVLPLYEHEDVCLSMRTFPVKSRQHDTESGWAMGLRFGK